jgi:hypothetical protein
MTAWDDQESMRNFMAAVPHRAAMPRLLDWCDEASLVHWVDPGDALPSWAEVDRLLRSNGRPSKVRHPSPRHASLAHPPPRVAASAPIRAARK